jgi:uncharacterized membrane protein YedE/YeeE
MTTVTALIAGLLFGVGLLLSGMTNPSNVLAFLDVAGHWQPSLAFTMAAAVAVATPAYAFAHRSAQSILDVAFEWPERYRLDRRLLIGSAIFGVGWGLSGICPGPGLVLLTRLDPRALVFFAGTVMGMLIADQWPRGAGRVAPAADAA